jgi:hypothetical protein
MAVYTTAKCGHCGENWTKLNPNAPNTVFGKIGPPVIRCVSCLKDNKTGYKLIRDFNLLEKLLYVKVKNIFGIILSLVFIAMGVYLGNDVAYDESLDDSTLYFFLAFACGFILFGAMGIRNNISGESDLDYTQELFDKNGGFVWSYEMYGI